MDSYNVVHVTEDATQSNFGVAAAMFELIARSKVFSSQQVAAAGDGSPLKEIDGVGMHFSRLAWWATAWRYAPSLSRNLDVSLKQHSVIHIHGIWMAPQWIAARYAIAHAIPFIITPHNMLGGWLWHRGRIRRLKKSLYWRYLVGPVFRQAAAIHALTSDECATLKEFFPNTTIVTIPNGIDLENIQKQLSGMMLASEKYLLSLGRLHPVKGLELLFQAMAKIPENWRMNLIVAGCAASEVYERSLKELVNMLGIEASVKFVGQVGGLQKWELLSGAWAVISPSYSEGMSMVALEAMACSTPVVTTHAAGFAELPEWGGLLVNPEADELHVAIMDVITWSLDEREKRGERALELVCSRYSWDVVAQRYDHLYQQALMWLNRSGRPS
jgi:glycosyltransferase involved in cell wall biosynthesis